MITNTNTYSEEKYLAMRTAFLTAFPRIFTDISNSKELFFESIQLAKKENFIFSPELFVTNLSIEIEGRYKALDSVLNDILLQKYFLQNSVVIELAAGLSPRKLNHINYKYYEVDFLPILQIKKSIYETLDEGNHEDCLFAVDLEDSIQLHTFLERLLDITAGKNVIFISEGLFWYMEKQKTHDLCGLIFEYFPNSLWITADCPVQRDNYVQEQYRNVISKSAKTSCNHTFKNQQDFMSFFEEMGFVIKNFKITELLSTSQISSGSIFEKDSSVIRDRLNSYTDIAIIGQAQIIEHALSTFNIH